MRRFIIALAATALALSFFASCSDSTQDKVNDAAQSVKEDAENAAGTVSANAVAQSLRAALKAKDLPNGTTERNVSVLRDAVRDLPGDPDVTGIEDRDGDGKDDDGKVQVNVGDQSACLTISRDGKDTNVDNGKCT
jgi:glucose/arabinose dehydrogenase